MSLLNSLKIVTAKRPAPVSPIARRREDSRLTSLEPGQIPLGCPVVPTNEVLRHSLAPAAPS